MKKIVFSYFVEEDILHIKLDKKISNVGNEEFQEGVIIYRDNENPENLLAIEVEGFTTFKGDCIKVSQKDNINLSTPFKRIRMFNSLRDIMYTDPEQFEETLHIWGFTKGKEKPPVSTFNFDLQSNQLPMSTNC